VLLDAAREVDLAVERYRLSRPGVEQAVRAWREAVAAPAGPRDDVDERRRVELTPLFHQAFHKAPRASSDGDPLAGRSLSAMGGAAPPRVRTRRWSYQPGESRQAQFSGEVVASPFCMRCLWSRTNPIVKESRGGLAAT
jgi:hypothetical protein